MQRRAFVYFLTVIFSSAIAFYAKAENSACPSLVIPSYVKTGEPAGCACGEKLSSRAEESPYQGLKLVAQCGNQYFFSGSATYSGELYFENNPEYDAPMSFIIPALQPKPPFYSSHILNLTEYTSPEVVARTFKIRKELASRGKCLKSDAVVKVSHIYVSLGETDFDGSFATDYQIIKYGDFGLCKNGT